MISCKKALFFFLIFIFSLPVVAQQDSEMTLSARKWIYPVFIEQPDLNYRSQVMKHIKPNELSLPAGLERASMNDPFVQISGDFKNTVIEKKIANKVFESLFVEDGQWTFDKILEMTKQNMTDADFQQFSSTAGGIKGGAGRKFYNKVLQSNYILSYSVNDVRTMEEQYNRVDAANRKRADRDPKYTYKPSKRTDTGFLSNITAVLYRIDMSDEDLNQFETEIYGENGDNSEKQMIEALQKYRFKIKKVVGKVGSIDYTPSKESAKKNRLSNDKMLASLLSKSNVGGFIKTTLEATKEFNIETVLYDVKPLQIKIGTKEGLKRNDRFFVYELVQDSKGEIKKKRRGAIRAKGKPSDNKGVSSGNTEPTKFFQVQGRKLDKGMMIVENKNRGSVSFAYGHSIFMGLNGYVKYLNAGMGALDGHIFYDFQIPDTSFITYNISVALEKDFHLARNFYIGVGAGAFYEETIFVDPEIKKQFIPEEPVEGEEIYNQVFNYTLSGTAGFYIIPQLKLFGKVKYLPGEYAESSLFRQDTGIFPLERETLRYFVGLSLEL